MPLTTLHNIAHTLGDSSYKNSTIKIKDIIIDSNKVSNGSLFIAIIGKNFDGHNYIKQAQENGAAAIVASRKINSELPVIYVADTVLAFGEIAAFIRQLFQPIVFAITGSNGKTTTKNMLGAILKTQAKTLITKGNLNNHIGVPMTLCSLNSKYKYAVIEMGANHLGEIAYLCKLAKPDIALITNAADAHIGEFGSLENIIVAKCEIYQALTENGIAIINNNSPHKAQFLTAILTNKKYFFGNDSNLYASAIKQNIDGLSFTLNYNFSQINIKMPLIGKHNVNNALAAASCALSQNISLVDIALGLSMVQGQNGRMSIYKNVNMTVIDDSYNANPESMRAAIITLAEFSGTKVLVLGEMAELGKNTKTQHLDIVKLALINNIDYIYSLADKNNYYEVENFTNKDTLAKNILTIHRQDTILVKGSRCAKMDELVKIIT